MLIHVNCVLFTATEVLAASLQQEHETNNQGAGMAKFHLPATTSKSFLLFLYLLHHALLHAPSNTKSLWYQFVCRVHISYLKHELVQMSSFNNYFGQSLFFPLLLYSIHAVGSCAFYCKI